MHLIPWILRKRMQVPNLRGQFCHQLNAVIKVCSTYLSSSSTLLQERSTSKLIQVVGRTHFLAAVRPRSLYSHWQSGGLSAPEALTWLLSGPSIFQPAMTHWISLMLQASLTFFSVTGWKNLLLSRAQVSILGSPRQPRLQVNVR